MRDLTEIAKRYFKSGFIFDIIALIPFASFFEETNKHRKLFYLIKVVRMKRGYHLLASNQLMREVKKLF